MQNMLLHKYPEQINVTIKQSYQQNLKSNRRGTSTSHGSYEIRQLDSDKLNTKVQ